MSEYARRNDGQKVSTQPRSYQLPSPVFDTSEGRYFWHNPRTWKFPYKKLIYGTLQEYEKFMKEYALEEIDRIVLANIR